MRRRFNFLLTGALLAAVALLGARWGQAAALAGTLEEALQAKGIPVVAVSAELSGRLAIVYRHGAAGHAGPNTPFYNEAIEATLRSQAGQIDSFRLTILDAADRVVLTAIQPLPAVADPAPRQGRDPGGIRAALGALAGSRSTVTERESGIEAEVRLTLAEGEVQAALDRAVGQVADLVEAEEAHGLTRLSLVVDDAEGDPLFTMVADRTHRVWRAWTAPTLRNPLADGPPGPQKR